MTGITQTDQAGRSFLSTSTRVTGGNTIAIKVKGDAIDLRPSKATRGVKRVKGVLVVTSNDTLPASRDFITEEREARLRELMRRGKRGK